ncbi:hypothetical protein C6499_09800 [Candidatus Poribacteria bacterium]|nr:MAG: hypothetical protein C6499_09800 [Candidatus Poribacteria bacterium]
MRKKFLSLSFIIVLAFLTVCFSNAVPDQSVDTPSPTVSSDSVLHLIPEKTLGIIYCPNAIELDNKINTLFTDLSPQSGSPEILAQMLASALGANFESLADFEAIGLDLNRDFAIFLTGLKPLQLSAAIHLKDTETIKQVIETETGGSTPTAYKNAAYWSENGDGNSFAILDDILVFSQQRAVCENVIDTRNGTIQAITENRGYQSFLTDVLEGTDQLGVCFDIEGVIASLDGSLEEEWKSMTESLKNNSGMVGLVIGDLFEDILRDRTEFIKQLQSVNARLQMEGTDVQITPSLEFKTDSEFVNVLQEVSADLTHLGELPNRATLNAAFQGSSKLLTEISTSWLDFTPQDIRNKQEKGDQLLEQVKEFYESLADRWSISTSFGDGVLPNHLFIYELKDEQRAITYIDEVFLEKLNFKTAYVGPSTIHKGVEIKSYIFPNLKETFDGTLLQTVDLDIIPPEWHWYYAFTDGQLLFATGTNPQLIQTALDRRAGNGEKFSNYPSYQGLIGKLGADSNVLLAVSPITALKSMLPVIEQMEPESVMIIQMYSGMLMNLPESYSIGFSAKARESGIDGKLLLTLGDFKPLIQAFGMMLGM